MILHCRHLSPSISVSIIGALMFCNSPFVYAVRQNAKVCLFVLEQCEGSTYFLSPLLFRHAIWVLPPCLVSSRLLFCAPSTIAFPRVNISFETEKNDGFSFLEDKDEILILRTVLILISRILQK